MAYYRGMYKRRRGRYGRIRRYRKYRRGYSRYRRYGRGSIKSYINKQIKRNVETKTWEKALDSQNVDSGGTLQGQYLTMASLSQSTSANGRIGNQIRVNSFRMKGTITVADTTNFVRMIMFVWKPVTSSATPSVAYLLDTGWSSNYSQAYYNHDVFTKNEVTILKDKSWVLDTYHPIVKFNWTFKFKGNGLLQTFDASSSTDCSNQIYCLMISDSSAVAHPAFLCNYRQTYRDG